LKRGRKLWDERNQRESLIQYIESQTKIIHSNTRASEDLVRYARAEIIMGDYFSPTDSEKATHWENAANWAETALTFNPEFRNAVLFEKRPTEMALQFLKRKEVDALYWYAISLERWAHLKGVSTELKYSDRIKKMIDRVAALQPNFLFGAVHRFYGMYYALRPGMNEEDLKQSRSHFERALHASSEYFANHVLFAEYYAKKVDNQALMKKHLEAAAKGNPKHLKDDYPEQVLEQEHARTLLQGGTP
jgi:tetratricopeptide (TPR) repeat protein